MANKPLNISESAAVQMPMKTVASLILLVAAGVFAYTELTARLVSLETSRELFENDLLKKSEITKKGLKELEKRFHFTHMENSEIFAAWATLAIPRGYQNSDFDDKVSEFLKRVGRRKFLTPIYRALINSGKKAFAQKIYSEARSGYHSVSQETLDDLLK